MTSRRSLERIAFRSVWLLLAAVTITPIWITRFLPLVDDPNHLSAVYIWRGLSDPNSPLHRFYELKLAPVSYFLHYFIATQAAFLVGVEAGHKLALCVYVLGIPLAAALWCKRTGRSVWLSVLTFPLPYSFFWAFGFHPFDLGIAVLLFAIVAFDALFERVSAGRLAAAAALGALCYLSHPIPLAMLGMAVPVLLVAWTPSFRKLAAAALALSPAFLLLRWQAGRTSREPIDWPRVSGGSVLTLDPEQWWIRLGGFDEYVMDVVSGTLDTQLFWALLICGGLLLLAGLVRSSQPELGRSWLFHYRSLALALVMLAGFLTLPIHFGDPVAILIVSGRLAPVAFGFFLLSAAVGAGDFRRWLALPGAVIALVAALNICAKYRKFADYMRPLPELVARCEPGSDVLTLNMEPHDFPETTGMVPFRLLPAWVQVLHGGYAPDAWVRPIPFPFAIKHAPPAPTWLAPAPTPKQLRGPYQCIVAHNLNQRLPHRWKLIERVGDWSVYRRRSKRPRLDRGANGTSTPIHGHGGTP